MKAIMEDMQTINSAKINPFAVKLDIIITESILHCFGNTAMYIYIRHRHRDVHN